MQKKENFLPFFITFFCLSILLLLIGKSGLFNSVIYLFNRAAVPVEQVTVNVMSLSGLKNKRINDLVLENSELRKKAITNKEIISENKALKDQFIITSPKSIDLIPAKIVGSPGFIPGVTQPEYFVIDKGIKNGVKNGDTVVVKNNLIGRIVNATDFFAKIEIVTSKNSSFTAEIENTDGANNVAGIIKGNGNYEMTLENVLLTEELKKESIILTKAEKDENGIGYPEGLVIGEIISIEKKSSDLFQRAKVRSFIDFKDLNIVFVYK